MIGDSRRRDHGERTRRLIKSEIMTEDLNLGALRFSER